MRASPKSAKHALQILLSSAVLGWLLFIAALYTDAVIETGREIGDAYTFVRPSNYLTFAAILIFAAGALWAKKKLQSISHDAVSVSTLVKSAQRFASTALIIALVLSASTAISVFMQGFFEATNDFNVPVRILNSYLPIVLYTALVVAVLLAGFVFKRHQDPAAIESDIEQPPSSESFANADSNGQSVATTPLPAAQRSIALSFAIPIIAVAIALILGLIVYDVTQTAIEVWIWVLIQALVAAGIITGTFYAKKSLSARPLSAGPPAGPSVGAKNLNFVLSIVFVSVVSLMSLTYGLIAVDQLRVQTDLSIYASEKDPNGLQDSLEMVQFEDMTLQINGSDLQRNSTATMTVEPGGIQIFDAKVDRDGYLWGEEEFPTDIEQGEYTLQLQAESSDGLEMTVELEVIFHDDGTVSLPNGYDANYSEDISRLMPLSASWFFGDLLPAFLLFVLAISVVYTTLLVRNRDHDESEPTTTH